MLGRERRAIRPPAPIDEESSDMTHLEDDRAALAAGETYLVHILETSTPPGNPEHYRITDAVEAHHAETGSWDIEAAGPDAARELLARHGL